MLMGIGACHPYSESRKGRSRGTPASETFCSLSPLLTWKNRKGKRRKIFQQRRENSCRRQCKGCARGVVPASGWKQAGSKWGETGR